MKVLLTSCVLLGLVLSAKSGELAAGWQALGDYEAARALQLFERALVAPEAATEREARFGQGVALLAKQPIDAAQVETARRIFEELAGSGTDDAAQGARFCLARIAQHHAPQSDEAAAARHYRQLIAEHRESSWAQTALSRLAILQIYALDAGQPPAARLAAAEKLLAEARGPAAASELHLVLAEAVFFYRLPAGQALPHLLAVEKLGQVDAVIRADTLVQIAEVSARQGDRAQAKVFYEKLLAEFPRDQRHYMVKQKLAALGEVEIAP